MVPNIVPTKIKILTVHAPTLPEVDALAESTFLEWSKDNPSAGICQVDRATVAPSEHQLVNRPDWHITITILYDLVQQSDAVNTLMRDLDVAMQAWSGWVKSSKDAGRKLTLTDMQIHMSQPMAKLLASFHAFRNW